MDGCHLYSIERDQNITSYKIERKYGKCIQDIYEKRMSSDYDVLTSFSENEVNDLSEKMKETLREIEKLL